VCRARTVSFPLRSLRTRRRDRGSRRGFATTRERVACRGWWADRWRTPQPLPRRPASTHRAPAHLRRPQGLVVRQSPSAVRSHGPERPHRGGGRAAAEGRVRRRKGRPLAEVQAALTQAKFVVTVHHAFDDNVAKDTVVDTDPPGSRGRRVSRRSSSVSDGPNPVPIPNVAGKTYEEAAAALARTTSGGAGTTSTTPSTWARSSPPEPAAGSEAPARCGDHRRREQGA
jgi:hypothetical protein